MSLASTLEIIEELKAGRMVILVDEEDRENEGDLVMAAEFVTPEAINFMATLRARPDLPDADRGALPPARPAADGERQPDAARHRIHRLDRGGRGRHHRHFRRRPRRTIQAAVAAMRRPDDIVQPGHIFPLRAQPGGVLVRAGHTEAGCDLAGLAGLVPASVICEILKDDGTMARLPDLIAFAQEHGLKIGTIADLIHYRSQHREPGRARGRAPDRRPCTARSA